MHIRSRWPRIAVLALGLVLAGCGESRQQVSRAPGAGGSAVSAGRPAPAAADDAELNSAVSLAPSSTLFNLKFKLASAPEVGRPAQVVLVVLPAGNVNFDRVHITLRPGDGLRLLSDSALDTTEFVAGQPIRYEVTVQPDAPGVLTLSVTLGVDAESNSLTRTYTIPLVAVPATSAGG